MGITKPIKMLLYLHWFEKCAFELPTVGTDTYHGERVVQLPPRTRLSCGCWNCGIPRNENGKTSYSQCEIDFIATRAVNGLISSWHIQFSLKKNGNRDLYRS